MNRDGRECGGVKAAERSYGVRTRERLTAFDPGLLRLTAGLRTVGSIALALVLLTLAGADVTHLVAGAMAGMVSTFAIREKHRGGQAVTLALGLPVALASVSLGALLNPHRVFGDTFFVLLIFGAVYSRRFGDRGTALGLIGFQIYFLSLFVGATVSGLPQLYLTLVIAFGSSALVRFVLLPETPAGILRRLRVAFRSRLAQLVTAQLALLDAAGPQEAEKAIEAVRQGTGRLHETAMMIQGRLAEGTPDEAAAELVQRRIADAEIAAERLGLLLLTARSAERADTLTLHLPGAPVPTGAHRQMPGKATDTLRRDLEALRLLVLRPVDENAGTGYSHVRNRLIGYREEENLPAAPATVQDVFRGIGESARSVLGLRIALDGAVDESDDSPATTRSREELDAEDAAIGGVEDDGTEEELTGLRRLTTRAAVQVTVGASLAIVGGEFLSEQRWYWAVLTCWIVFLNTSSTGEIVVKGSRRLLGTVLGVVAGIALAGLVGHHTWTAFALVLVFLFAMFYTAPLSYTLMSFFVTAALGLLYTLLHTYSRSVLFLRIEETALGAACGIIAAALVLPVHTSRRTNELLDTALDRLARVTEAAVDQLSGGTATDLLDRARDLDEALADLRAGTQPLTHPVTPLRSRRNTARYVVALLETCAYHARALAATAELLPTHPSIAADPRLRGVGRRVAHNIGVIAAHLSDGANGAEVETGPSIASMLEHDLSGTPRYGRITDRVLRHLQRLDEGVVGLARPLGAPVAAPRG